MKLNGFTLGKIYGRHKSIDIWCSKYRDDEVDGKEQLHVPLVFGKKKKKFPKSSFFFLVGQGVRKQSHHDCSTFKTITLYLH